MKMQARHVVELVEGFTRRYQIVMEDLRQQITRLVEARSRDAEEIERLQAQLASTVFQPMYDGEAHDREQMEQDAALGRLVRAMPTGYGLINTGVNFPWEAHDETGRRFAHKTPEQALRAAGIGQEEANQND